MSGDLFEDDLDLPDIDASRRYASLVGLDAIKERLGKEAELLLKPQLLEQWSTRHHGTILRVVRTFRDRPPLMIFAGDVGTGKTTLAETFGDDIARRHNIPVKALRLSLRSRGTGAVGEMTRLIGAAFDTVLELARKTNGRRPTILIIDEADAVAQSRELAQMHHEDRAGVNALIRGIDQVAGNGVVVVMCTNRLGALDPAIRRRAAAEFEFSRPNDRQRETTIRDAFEGVAIGAADMAQLVRLTGPGDREYGYTYSDLINKVVPAVVLAAYPERPITTSIIVEQLREHPPTPPFTEEGA